VIPLLARDPFVLQLKGSFVVSGDLHGNIEDLVRIFGAVGYPPSVKHLFLGDYVDRGKHSIEILILLYSLKVLFPTDIYLLRGNHENIPMCGAYGFETECLSRTSKATFDELTNTFRHLPIACVLNCSVFCVHGGISPTLGFVHELSTLTKPVKIPKYGLIADLVWSDPQKDIREWAPGRRGIAHDFGYIALAGFLSRNNLKFLLRSHQPCNGFEWAFSDRPEYSHHCLTIFSTSNYCNLGNHGSVASIDMDGSEPVLTSLAPLTEEDKEKYRVVFPHWLLLKGGRKTDYPFDLEDGPASEPNPFPLP
jgi:diadenosine tetraphosphatase ApaH/serine/threonine PP2A family protein phosphatase